MTDVMHQLLLYLLPPRSYKRGIEKTTLLQIDLFVKDHDIEKFVWQCLDEDDSHVKPFAWKKHLVLDCTLLLCSEEEESLCQW